jgi:hypothetical protein
MQFDEPSMSARGIQSSSSRKNKNSALDELKREQKLRNKNRIDVAQKHRLSGTSQTLEDKVLKQN